MHEHNALISLERVPGAGLARSLAPGSDAMWWDVPVILSLTLAGEQDPAPLKLSLQLVRILCS